jgi:UPF0755 protein
MTVQILDEPDYDRRRSDWEVDEWDEVAEVPVVEQIRQQTRIVKWTVWVACAVVIALVLVAGYVGWWYLGKVQPEGEAGPPVAFTVTRTDTLLSLSERLEEQGFVVDADVFRWYVDQQGGLDLTPGFYQLPVNDHMGNVLSRLRTPPGETYQRVTFPEGFTVAQMGERLAETSPRLDADEFVAAANSPDLPSLLRPAGVRSMEGLLFPDTYQFSNADNEAQIVLRMASLMERVAEQEDLVARAEQLNISPYDVLIIASMIEKEAKLDVDRPKIARVIYNRLFLGMNLQIDATLYYEGDRDTPVPVLRQTPGPYNTYLNEGLPPTPIANPGRASIQAALNPAPNPPPGDPICRDLEDPTQNCLYLYYVLADEDGGHAFATTLEQHEENIRRARAAGLL